jgi:hypothetical protein
LLPFPEKLRDNTVLEDEYGAWDFPSVITESFVSGSPSILGKLAELATLGKRGPARKGS